MLLAAEEVEGEDRYVVEEIYTKVFDKEGVKSVSYTHLTLPTKRIV